VFGIGNHGIFGCKLHTLRRQLFNLPVPRQRENAEFLRMARDNVQGIHTYAAGAA
jgi:hypothetical protein